MKKSKEKFFDFRQSTPNHRDRNYLQYLKQTEADKAQISHLMGDVQRWK